MGKMKRTVRENISGLPYSLHDSHINKIKFKETENGFAKVKMLFDKGYFLPEDGDALPVQGGIIFEQVDLDFADVYIMKISGLNHGKIRGRKYSLKKFCNKFREVDMEIIDETYGYHLSNFSGWMYTKNKIYEFTIGIYHMGDMIYLAEK